MKTVINKVGLVYHIKKKGLSFQAFSDKVGITRMSLNNYMELRSYPTVDIELKICIAAGMPRRWLYMSEKRYSMLTDEQLKFCNHNGKEN